MSQMTLLEKVLFVAGIIVALAIWADELKVFL